MDLLRQEGIGSSLIDMGESPSFGAHPDGGPRRIGIADPDQPERIGATLEGVDQAVATSAAWCISVEGSDVRP